MLVLRVAEESQHHSLELRPMVLHLRTGCASMGCKMPLEGCAPLEKVDCFVLNNLHRTHRTHT